MMRMMGSVLLFRRCTHPSSKSNFTPSTSLTHGLGMVVFQRVQCCIHVGVGQLHFVLDHVKVRYVSRSARQPKPLFTKWVRNNPMPTNASRPA